MVGGILGTIADRSVSNHVKTAPLRQAIEHFEAERARAQEELRERHRQSRGQTLAYIRQVEAELRQTLRELEREHRARANEAKAAFDQAVRAFVQTVPERLEAAAARLARQPREVLPATPRSPWWAVQRAGARIAAFIGDQAWQLNEWTRQQAATLRDLRRRVDEEAARLGL